MLNVILPALFLLAQPAPPAADVPTENVAATTVPVPATGTPAPAPARPAAATPAPAASPATPGTKPLGFLSERYPFRWDQLIQLPAEVDGLKINSIFFNKRSLTILKSADFGTRAVVAVTNTANATRVPGFAVAVFDAEDRLLGVASGGPKIGGVTAGTTDSFTLSFSNVTERIPRADHFVLAVELTN